MQPNNRQGSSNGPTRRKRPPGAASDRHRMQPDNRRGSSDGTTRGKRLPGAASDRYRMQPDTRRGRDTGDIPAASEGRPAAGTHIRGALPAPLPRYRGIRPRDTAKQMRRSICSAASIPSRAPGRFDTRPETLRAYQINPLSFFSRTARSMSSVMDFISHFGFQPHSSRAQLSSRLSGQLRAMASFTGSTS